MWGLGGELFGRNCEEVFRASEGALVANFRREFWGSIQGLLGALVANFSEAILGRFQGLAGGALVANFSGGIVRKFSGASGPWWRTFWEAL